MYNSGIQGIVHGKHSNHHMHGYVYSSVGVLAQSSTTWCTTWLYWVLLTHAWSFNTRPSHFSAEKMSGLIMTLMRLFNYYWCAQQSINQYADHIAATRVKHILKAHESHLWKIYAGTVTLFSPLPVFHIHVVSILLQFMSEHVISICNTIWLMSSSGERLYALPVYHSREDISVLYITW